jgi:hypothetical protein
MSIAENKQKYSAFIKHLKDSGIEFKSRSWDKAGNITVFVKEHGLEFCEDDQRFIRAAAIQFGYTWVRKMEINIEQMTNPYSFAFYA